MVDGRDGAEHAGIGDENVEFAPAFEDRAAELVDRRHVREVEGHQRCRAADRLDRIVKFLEAADGASAGDDMRTGLGEFEGSEIADPARCAGDQRNAAVQVDAHDVFNYPLLAMTETFRPIVSPSLSRRRVG